jgi:hypothetical protein
MTVTEPYCASRAHRREPVGLFLDDDQGSGGGTARRKLHVGGAGGHDGEPATAQLHRERVQDGGLPSGTDEAHHVALADAEGLDQSEARIDANLPESFHDG